MTGTTSLFSRLALTLGFAFLSQVPMVDAQDLLFQQLHRKARTETEVSFLLANQLQSHPDVDDDLRTKAWDDFQLIDDATLSSLNWTGAFDSPFAADAIDMDLDFVVEIYADQRGTPDVETLVASWQLDAGVAGNDDGNDVVSSIRAGETSPLGGPIYNYAAELSGATFLEAGSYWLSITASQTFPNPSPIVDPAWGWHFGSGSNNGSFHYDGFDSAAEPGVAKPNELMFKLFGTSIFKPGDLNSDGRVSIADWTLFVEGFDSDLRNLTPRESHLLGDFDQDGSHSAADFITFRQAFDAENGEGSFVEMQAASVPEPDAMTIYVGGLALALLIGRRRRGRIAEHSRN